MSQRTHIQWTDRSSNPLRVRDTRTNKVGWHCEKVSSGCASCYSEAINGRFGTGAGFTRHAAAGLTPFVAEKELESLLRLRKPCRIFLCDMTDIFFALYPDPMLDRVFAAMAVTPWNTYQVLTKRIERGAKYLSDPETPRRIADAIEALRPTLETIRRDWGLVSPTWNNLRNGAGWPLPNVWLGVSAEDQRRADERIPRLLKAPAALRFLSLEPLLGPIDLTRLDNGCGETFDALRAEVTIYRPGRRTTFRASDADPIAWVIAGGESGKGARPCDFAWLRSIVRQCKAAAVPAFIKQLGSHPVGEWLHGDPPTYTLTRPTPKGLVNTMELSRFKNGRWKLRDSKGGYIDEWPDDLKIRQFPKEVAHAS